MKAAARRPTRCHGRDLPNYTAGEAASYLGLSASAVRCWSAGPGNNPPLIKAAGRSPLLLSFFNLAEIHIISAIRRERLLKAGELRTAIDWLKRRRPGCRALQDHPLLDEGLMADGLDSFVEKYARLIDIGRSRRAALKKALEGSLDCIGRDDQGIPVLLYPRYKHGANDSKIIEIDSGVSGGRPIIRGTNLATSVIAERFRAGESIADLAWDYGREQEEIEDLIRIETSA